MQTESAPADRPPQPELLPRTIGRDELNLAEFPLTALAHRVPCDRKELVYQDQIRDQNSGEIIPRRLTITGDAKYGLPTSLDDDVIVALIHTTKEANSFTARTVPFSRMAVIELLGWPRNGQSLRRLDESLNRWLGVTLRYKNAWWDKAAQEWVNESFHILDNLTIYDQQAARRIRRNPAQTSPPLSTFSWNDIVFRSFQAENLKRLDLSLYFKLSLAPSKRAYRFLDKRFYRSPIQRFDLRYFACEHIGFSRDYTAAKIKEKLQPALDELEGVGFLEPMSREGRYEKVGHGEWRIILVQGKDGKALESPPAREEPESPLAATLIERGVTAAVARELVRDHAEEEIQLQMEYLDWLIEHRPKRRIGDPAAYLVSAIRTGNAAPGGYESPAVRQAREEAQQAEERRKADERRREREEQARERAMQKAVHAYWDALTPMQQAALDAVIDAQADAETLATEQGPLQGTFRRIRRHDYIRQLLEDRERTAVEA
jgi:Replication initiator protein A